MTDAIYKVPSGGAIALAASASKTVLGVKAHANSGLLLTGYGFFFDGVTASMAPPAIEFMSSSFATNPIGTNSTTVTPWQMRGRVMAAGFTAGRNWTAEPTVLASLWDMYFPIDKGVLIYDYPLGTEPDLDLAAGLVVRITTLAGVSGNFRGYLKLKRV